MSLSPAAGTPLSRLRGFLVLSVSLIAGGVQAHDLWIVPGKFHLREGETTRVFINNGDVFPESLSLLGSQRVFKLQVHSATSRRGLADYRIDGKSLSFDLRADDAGSNVIALATRVRRVRLQAVEFNEYLEAERLSQALALREQLDEREDAAIENYSKWAKSIVLVGDPSEDPDEDATWSRPVGHKLELVPRTNPNLLQVGKALSLLLLFDGEPLPEAPVVGGRAGGPALEIEGRTDAGGAFVASFDAPGRWFLRALHMTRADEVEGVDWESFWCTLTVEVR